MTLYLVAKSHLPPPYFKHAELATNSLLNSAKRTLSVFLVFFKHLFLCMCEFMWSPWVSMWSPCVYGYPGSPEEGDRYLELWLHEVVSPLTWELGLNIGALEGQKI